MIFVKMSKCLNVTRISFIPRKMTYNYFLTKYYSFPYTIQNLKKKILIDAHVNDVKGLFNKTNAVGVVKINIWLSSKLLLLKS